jgi:ATP-dependent DNA ligase
VNFRLGEFQSNLPHLIVGFDDLIGTVLDGELVCPLAAIDTGDTTTTHALQAAVAILATSPENASAIQERHQCHLRFVAFDVLRFQGRDMTSRSLRDRLTVLEEAFLRTNNCHLALAETHLAEKALAHELILAEGKEGSVWKRLDGRYEPGRRVRHWLKRKKAIEAEAVVSGFRPGTRGKGNEHSVGAIEFSTVAADGKTSPIAWVSSLTDEERERMTRREGGIVTLDPSILGRRALVAGHDIAGRSGRYRHARIVRWLDAA